MRKHIVVFLAACIYLAAYPHEAYASTKISQPSASLASTLQTQERDDRVQILREYFASYNSPLASEAETFIIEADKNNLDYRLLPAIAGVESWFGTQIPYDSYNGWGWGVYGDNVTHFTSWEDGISTISKELRERYMDQWGADNVYEIGSYYAADPAWAQKVTHFMDDIAEFESRRQNKPISISI
jgi:hypothetical protein